MESNEKKTDKWCLLFLCAVAVACFAIACLIIGFGGLWGGTTNISLIVDNVKASASTATGHPLKSYTEKTGWPTIHFLENFYLTLLLPTIFTYHVRDQSRKWISKKKALMYFASFMTIIAFAAFWELAEVLVVTVTDLMEYWGFPERYILYKFGSESMRDVFLNDIVQAGTAGIVGLAFVYFNIIKPVSWLLFNKRWYQIFIRAIVWTGFELMVFGSIFRKKCKGNIYFNFGFWAVLFLKFIGITILFIEDKSALHLTDKRRKAEINANDKTFIGNVAIRREDPLTQMDINVVYILIYVIHIVLWICTGDLRAWGFFSSNAGALIVFFAFFLISYIIKQYYKQPTDTSETDDNVNDNDVKSFKGVIIK